MHKKIFLATLPVLVMLGCKKSFLEVDPQGQLTEVQALSDPDAASRVVGGVYNTLYFGGFDATTVGFLWAVPLEVASDNADKGSTPSDFGPLLEIDSLDHTPNNFIFNNVWRGHYIAIARANRAIDLLEKSTFDQTTKNRLTAEVRFLRGLYYFNLVRYFGGVPRVLRVPTDANELNSDEFQVRASKEQIYEVVVNDLQFAVDNLPMKGDPLTQVGRANKGAAQSYLAKVYLYLQNWQKAYDLSQEVINSGKYGLVQNYAAIFRERPVGGEGGNNNIESIFEVQTGINAGENAVSPLYSNSQGARSRGGWNDLGFGFNNPSLELVNQFEADDERLEATVIFIQPTVAGNSTGTILWDGFRIPTKDSVENERYNYKVYHSPLAESPQLTNNKDTKPKNIRLMRYAEVLLINAEAAARLGNTGEAATKLNLVRARANLPGVAGTLDNVLKERRVELAMEADRFFDLVRTGRAAAELGPSFVVGKNEVFPIPQEQRDLSGGKLTQNPGY